jgi:hypothetical protein
MYVVSVGPTSGLNSVYSRQGCSLYNNGPNKGGSCLYSTLPQGWSALFLLYVMVVPIRVARVQDGNAWLHTIQSQDSLLRYHIPKRPIVVAVINDIKSDY